MVLVDWRVDCGGGGGTKTAALEDEVGGCRPILKSIVATTVCSPGELKVNRCMAAPCTAPARGEASNNNMPAAINVNP